MEVTTGTVVDGKVVVEGPPLKEGARVTVVVADEGEVSLTEDQKAQLLRSISQADRGGVTDGWELLREIRSKA